MLTTNRIQAPGFGSPLSRVRSGRTDFSGQLAITMADGLLKTTRQYPKWEQMRQQDPQRACKAARLVLERHQYIAGRSPATERGRRHFDRLTHQLAAEGIFLYRSHQFADPIFKKASGAPTAQTDCTDAPRIHKNLMTPAKLLHLRRRFSQTDCLEFLAGVLEQNGISYYGKKGIAAALTDRALSENRNANAYLTGEGVTQLLSTEPTTIHVPADAAEPFEHTWKQIEPLLTKGAILSFSSRYFGHTGIIDDLDGRLSFFNASGRLDRPESYRVLAENLKSEVHNWCQRAKQKNTFLDITIGRVDRNLAARFDKAATADSNGPMHTIRLLT